MNDYLISVIVPMYCMEKYLRKCLDSISAQTYKNIEVILVDDGSPDKSGSIAEEYAQKDSRFKVIHKSNGGLSDARNTAIPLANGEYLTFIDSDDWISPYYIENLYHAITKENSDLAFSWFENVFVDKAIQSVSTNVLQGYECMQSANCLERMLYQNGVETSAWGKLYRRRIIAELRYPKNKLYEDIPVTYECIKRARKIAIIKNVDYYYFQRPDSIQNVSFNVEKMDAIEHGKCLMKSVERDFPVLLQAAKCRYFSILCNILFQIKDQSHEEIKHTLWCEIVKYRWDVIRNKDARKKARLAGLISLFGYKMMALVYAKTQWRG